MDATTTSKASGLQCLLTAVGTLSLLGVLAAFNFLITDAFGSLEWLAQARAYRVSMDVIGYGCFLAISASLANVAMACRSGQGRTPAALMLVASLAIFVAVFYFLFVLSFLK
jgi:hypothetical protein